MSERKFTIVGISDSGDLHLTPETIEIIKQGKIFSGGKRHHLLVRGILPPDAIWIDIATPLENVFKAYEGFEEILVFASGDPLFYGYATTIMREFPEASVRVYPTFNSLQMLAHRLLLPYADMVNVSLTGRSWHKLDVALLENRECIGVLTDKNKTPSAIASYLLDYGYDNYSICVGEQLGNEAEEIRRLSLEEAISQDFKTPNCVILKMIKPRRRFFGIPEDEFYHLSGRNNMITKMPVRLLSLSMLDLCGRKILWDIGFCTGSVSIEAKINFPELSVVAFEEREESRELLKKNVRKFGVPGIQGIIGDFMKTDLSGLPKPDAVFIGGHGGKLHEMIDRVSQYLNPEGVVVFNSVIPGNCKLFKEAVEKCGMKIVATHTIALDEHNPITIIKAR